MFQRVVIILNLQMRVNLYQTFQRVKFDDIPVTCNTFICVCAFYTPLCALYLPLNALTSYFLDHFYVTNHSVDAYYIHQI